MTFQREFHVTDSLISRIGLEAELQVIHGKVLNVFFLITVHLCLGLTYVFRVTRAV